MIVNTLLTFIPRSSTTVRAPLSRCTFLVGVLLLLGCFALYPKDAKAQITQRSQAVQTLFGTLGPLYAFDAVDIITSVSVPAHDTTSALNVTPADEHHGERYASSNRLLFWGQGRSAYAKREVGAVDYDSEVQSHYVGADYKSRNWRHGLAFASNRAETERLEGAAKSNIDVTLNSILHYSTLGFGGVKLCFLVGIGQGETKYRENSGNAFTVDTRMEMATVCAKSQLLSLPQVDLGMEMSATVVKLSADSLSDQISPVSVQAHRLHVALTAKRKREVFVKQYLSTYAELGGRIDRGDDGVDNGSAVDIKFGINYYHLKWPLGVSAEGRWQIVDQGNDSDVASWGTGVKFHLRPDATGRGLSLAWRPGLRGALGDSEAVAGSATPALRHATPLPDGFGLQPQHLLALGYRWWMPAAGLLKAYAEFDFGHSEGDSLRFGLRLQPQGFLATPLEWSLHSAHRKDDGALRTALGLTAKLGF